MPQVRHDEMNPDGFLGNVRNQRDSFLGIGLFSTVKRRGVAGDGDSIKSVWSSGAS